MIKNIFLSMIFDKKAMQEVNTYKTSFFVMTFFIIFVIESSLSFFWVQITDKVSVTLVKFLTVTFVSEFIFILFDFLLGCVLLLIFYIKENTKIPVLLFKTIVSMNFIRLITSIITLFLQLGFFFNLLVIVYNFFFVTAYMKENLESEVSVNVLRKYVAVSFVSAFILMILIIRSIFYMISTIM